MIPVLLLSTWLIATVLLYIFLRAAIRNEVNRLASEEDKRWLGSLRGIPEAFQRLPDRAALIRQIEGHGRIMLHLAEEFPESLPEIRAGLEIAFVRAVARRDEADAVRLAALIENVKAAEESSQDSREVNG